jgi:hypothetical protein
MNDVKIDSARAIGTAQRIIEKPARERGLIPKKEEIKS